MFYEPLLKAISFELKCPYKALAYNVTNWKWNLKVNIPLPDFGKYCMSLDVYGKPKGEKGFIKALLYLGSGSLKQMKIIVKLS